MSCTQYFIEDLLGQGSSEESLRGNGRGLWTSLPRSLVGSSLDTLTFRLSFGLWDPPSSWDSSSFQDLRCRNILGRKSHISTLCRFRTFVFLGILNCRRGLRGYNILYNLDSTFLQLFKQFQCENIESWPGIVPKRKSFLKGPTFYTGHV